jgi:protocatechuate 3,4-dioxygenase beta subunit
MILLILIYVCLTKNPPHAMSQETPTQVEVGNLTLDLVPLETNKPKTTEGTMQVRVLGPDGKSIAGAKILTSVWTKEPVKHNQDYVCDDNGESVVDLPKTLDILRLWARKDGFVPLFAHWEQYDPEPIPKQFTFKLTKGTTIGGLVKNEDGQPIVDAKIEVSCSTPDGQEKRTLVNRWLAEEDGALTTDAQGRWTLNNVPKGDDLNVSIRLTHPDYVSDMTWGGMQGIQNVTLASLREQKGTIVMYRGISVTGTVTNPDGKPVAGAVLAWGDDPYAQTSSILSRLEVRSDEKGVYKIPPLPPLTMTLTVMAEGWAPDLRKISITRENPRVDFQLKPGKKLRLKFIDGAGKPIPQVYVGIEGWRGYKSLYNEVHPNVLDSKIPRQADKNGVYEWTWAPSDEVLYGFGKEGYEAIESREVTADGAEHVIRMSK